MASSGDTLHWKNKYEQSEKTLKLLTGYCERVVTKYEELLKKNNENEAKYKAVLAKLEEKDDQLAQVKKLWQPAYQEYEVIKEKYELEVECRFEAEHYATKVTRQNRELKRMSAAILDSSSAQDLIDGDLSDDITKDETEEHVNDLNDRITDLQDERCQLSAQVKQTWEELHKEKENHKITQEKYENVKTELKQTKDSLEQHMKAFKQLTEASEKAFEEYEQLKAEYEAAVLCKSDAETYASELYANHAAMKRESSILLAQVANDPRLMKALHEVEDLTMELETLKTKHKNQIEEMQEELVGLKDKDLIGSLENENKLLLDEKDVLSTRIAEVDARYKVMEKQYSELQLQYKQLDEKYKDATRPPPPPPPPPPPAPVVKKTNLFRRKSKMKREEVKKKLAVGGASTNDSYTKALEEMMKRIKDGRSLNKVLKPVNKPSPTENDGAMTQLHEVLNKMKRTRSESDLLSDAPKGIDENSELAKVFRRVKRADSEDEVFASTKKSGGLASVKENVRM